MRRGRLRRLCPSKRDIFLIILVGSVNSSEATAFGFLAVYPSLVSARSALPLEVKVEILCLRWRSYFVEVLEIESCLIEPVAFRHKL